MDIDSVETCLKIKVQSITHNIVLRRYIDFDYKQKGTLDDRIEANNNVCKMLFDVCRLCCHHLPVYYSVNVFVRPCFYFCLCKTQHVRRSLPYKEALQH